MKFTIIIKEIFNFQDGRIIFVGDIYNGPNYINKCTCDIFIEVKLFSHVLIEGEMIAKGNTTNLRSLSSLDKIDKSKIPYRDVEVKLICED